MATPFTSLSLTDIGGEFTAMARDAQSAFGHLDAQQLNWRPDATSWSVAQCFEHLLSVNRAMFQVLDTAVAGSGAKSFWQRLPLLPGLFGPIMIKSQMPEAKRKFRAPALATPSASAIDPLVVERFVAAQLEASRRAAGLDERRLANAVAVSPFASFVVYTALDGYRLVVTHQRRHFEQARRVMQAPGFPASVPGARI